MQLPNYKILDLIGQGGMANVYKAVDNYGQKVAVKILNSKYAFDQNIISRFETEAKVMETLQHPNIIKVKEFVSAARSKAIVMELVEGTDLSNIIKKKGPLSKDLVLHYMKQILSAIDFSHKHGIIHRDIKPSNILIDKKNRIKLIDFGVAKLAGNEISVTKTRTAIGTVIYMSPEQIKSSKNVDNLTDIYSLGVLLYFMLSGEHPYNNLTGSEYEIQSKIVNEPLPLITSYPEFNEIIQKATRKKPQERFLSCNDFMQALANLNTKDSRSTVVRDNYNSLTRKTGKRSVTNTSLLIGRSPEADIRINDQFVSRRHAILHVDFGHKTYHIQDLNSTSGTYVNGRKIKGNFTLRQGDKIKLGNTIIPWEDYIRKLAQNESFDNEINIDTNTTDIPLYSEPPTGFSYYIKAFKEYANFEGRASKQEYWYFVLFKVLFFIPVLILSVLVVFLLRLPPAISLLLIFLYLLVHLVPGISLGMRRIHDSNHPGWFLFIPIYNLVLLLSDGTFGRNEYGEDPISY